MMMKTMKRMMAALCAAAMLVILPAGSMMTAQAEEPVTYSVKYLDQGWYFEANTSVFNGNSHRELYYLLEVIKDGDTVVVYNDTDNAKELNLGNVRLSNLTYAGTKFTMVYAGSVDTCYVNTGTSGTINCDVKNAHVYDTSVFNFNKNVGELNIYAGDSVKSSVGCAGTVGHLKATNSQGNTIFDYYDFEAGVLHFENGTFKPTRVAYKTPEEHFASLPANAAGTDTPATGNDSDEYDDVPKTGQSSLYLWFLGAAVVCFAGSRALKVNER